MRKPVTLISPDTSVRAAAALMRELQIGALPVCKNLYPIGIVTDRDIVTRWACRMVSDCAIAQIMTRNVITCNLDQTIECAAHVMSDAQIRRLVVVDNMGRAVGILTLGDIANDANEVLAGQTLGEIVELR
ncbi:CBS domain-containing protein [Marivita sp. S0852]|uniref:CBS domain-containing protein n=1 Tax=Marivita sp. S0852 TaxID=3373893 RepID=UPI003982A910